MRKRNTKNNSFVWRSFILCFALLLFYSPNLFAQVISNNGAAISITSGIVINAKDAGNISGGVISNSGTFNLTGNYTSTATTNGSTGIMTLGGNWTNSGGIFVPGTSTVIFNGSDNQSLVRVGGETFYNLTIENSGAPTGKKLNLLNNVTVTGILSMNLGNVDAASYTLLLSNQTPSSLNYTSVTGSRIFGKFERGINQAGTYLFPLGTSSYYNPANLITNSISSSGRVLSEFITSPPPGNSGLPVPDPPVEVYEAHPDGYWSLKANNGFSSGNFNINLNGSGFTDTIRDITRVIKRTAGGNWIMDGTHLDASGTVVFRNNLAGNISPAGTHFALGRARPLITVHPVSLIVCEKTNPVFSVTATGAEPLTYIWYKDGIIITNGPHYSGARTNTLTIINAVLTDAGNYYCIVRDRYRTTTTSNSATLTVNKIPVATATPALQNHECSGIAFTNIVLGESYGVPGTTYIWTRDNPAGITSLVPLSGTALNIGDALSGSFTNITDAPITITFTITPVGPDPTYCVGIPIIASVTVNPTPRVIPLNTKPAICYGGSTEIELTSPTQMTQGEIKFDYTVTVTASPAIVAGNRASATDVIENTILSFPYTNESDTLQSVFYHITPKVVGLGCYSGIVKSPEVKIHAKPLQNLIITTPLTCEGGSDAALRAITSKGAGLYKFDWYGPSGDQVHGYSIPDIINRKGGRWDVIVTDNLNCSNSSFVFVEGAYLDEYLYVVDTTGYGTTCPGSNDGQLWIKEKNSSTGIPPFEYWIVRNSLDTVIHNFLPAIDIFQKYDSLLPGNYKVYLRDANGCMNDLSNPPPEANIIEPDIITVEFDADKFGNYNVSCKGYNDGSVWIKTISGGNGGYRYKWFTYDGAISGIDTLNRLDNITAGTYFLNTTDRKGCIKLDSVTLTEPGGMQLTSSEVSLSPDGNTNISCNGGDDGFIKLNVSGGSGVYTYSWSGPDDPPPASEISGLKAGSYTCTVTDLYGCILTPLPSFTLTEPSVLAVSAISSASTDGSFNINCNGGTGWINITVSGGSVTGEYKYTWSTSDGSGLVDGQEDQNTLTAGTYHLVVRDSNSCETPFDITLTQPPPLLINLSPKHITCQSPGFNNGSIDLTVTGGVMPYSYLWSNGALAEDITALSEGYYKVIVTDLNGCSVTDSVRINLPPPLNYTISLSDYNGFNISCNGLADGTIQLNLLSGKSPFIYNWTRQGGGFTATTKDISDLIAGQYYLSIIDSNYCTATETIDLTEPGKLGMTFSLSASIAGGFNINCAGENTGSIGIEPLNQVKSVEYLWSDGIFGKTRMSLPAGDYSVIITDANNCHASSSVTLTEPDSMKVAFDITQPFCPDKPDGEIRLNVTGGVMGADYSYKWSDNSTGRNLSNIQTGFYKVTATDINECSISDSVIVESLNETCLIIPNAISPNDDLINDVWNIGMIELYPEIEIKIFNRWGETIWRSEKGYPQPWDGRSNGKDLPIDSYHYIIDLHNGTKQLIGNVTIVR